MRQVDLATLLAEADIVTLHLPATPAPRHLIDRAALARMRPGATLINTARGDLVDQAALIEALIETVDVADERIGKWIRALRRHWLSDDELAAISVPVTILAPRPDLWHAGPTVAMAEALGGRIPAARVTILEDAGSLIALEDPARIAGLFFDAVGGRPG